MLMRTHHARSLPQDVFATITMPICCYAMFIIIYYKLLLIIMMMSCPQLLRVNGDLPKEEVFELVRRELGKLPLLKSK